MNRERDSGNEGERKWNNQHINLRQRENMDVVPTSSRGEDRKKQSKNPVYRAPTPRIFLTSPISRENSHGQEDSYSVAATAGHAPVASSHPTARKMNFEEQRIMIENKSEPVTPKTSEIKQGNESASTESGCKFKGVIKMANGFKAVIQLNGKKENLGIYPTAIEAARAYDKRVYLYNKKFNRKKSSNFLFTPKGSEMRKSTKKRKLSHKGTQMSKRKKSTKPKSPKTPLVDLRLVGNTDTKTRVILDFDFLNEEADLLKKSDKIEFKNALPTEKFLVLNIFKTCKELYFDTEQKCDESTAQKDEGECELSLQHCTVLQYLHSHVESPTKDLLQREDISNILRNIRCALLNEMKGFHKVGIKTNDYLKVKRKSLKTSLYSDKREVFEVVEGYNGEVSKVVEGCNGHIFVLFIENDHQEFLTSYAKEMQDIAPSLDPNNDDSTEEECEEDEKDFVLLGDFDKEDKSIFKEILSLHKKPTSGEKSLLYPNQVILAEKIWDRIKETLGDGVNKFHSIDFLIVGPNLRSVRSQTLSRLKDFYHEYGEILVKDENYKDKYVMGDSEQDVKKFEKFRTSVLSNEKTLHVLIHDECHWGFQKGNIRDYILNDNYKTKGTKAKTLNYNDSRKYHKRENVIQLLLSATPFVCQTFNSRIYEENEIALIECEKDALISGEYDIVLTNFRGNCISYSENKRSNPDIRESEGEEPHKFTFKLDQNDKSKWNIHSANGAKLFLGNRNLSEIPLEPKFMWGADTITFLNINAEGKRRWLIITETAGWSEKPKTPNVGFFYYKKIKKYEKESKSKRYVSLNHIILTGLKGRSVPEPRLYHFGVNIRKSLLRSDPLTYVNNKIIRRYFRVLSDYIYEIIRQGVFIKKKKQDKKLVQNSFWDDVDGKVESVISIFTGKEMEVKKSLLDVKKELEEEMRKYRTDRLKQHIEVLKFAKDEDKKRAALIQIARHGGLVDQKGELQARQSYYVEPIANQLRTQLGKNKRLLDRINWSSVLVSGCTQSLNNDMENKETHMRAEMEETERIIWNLLNWKDKAKRGSVNVDEIKKELPQKNIEGPMICIRISRRKFADEFLRGIKSARNIAKVHSHYAILADYGSTSISDSIAKDETKNGDQPWKKWLGEKSERKDLSFEDLNGMPCIVIVVSKARMGDTFPASLKCLDMRAKRMGETSLPSSSTFIQELGRLCRYASEQDIKTGNLPYALLDRRTLNFIPLDNVHLPCIMDTRLNLDKGVRNREGKDNLPKSKFREKYECTGSKMDYRNKEKVKNRFLLIAEPQYGKTGTFLALLLFLKIRLQKLEEEEPVQALNGAPLPPESWNMQYFPHIEDDMKNAYPLASQPVCGGKYGKYSPKLDLYAEWSGNPCSKDFSRGEQIPQVTSSDTKSAECKVDKKDFGKHRSKKWSLGNIKDINLCEDGKFLVQSRYARQSKEFAIKYSCPQKKISFLEDRIAATNNCDCQQRWVFYPSHCPSTTNIYCNHFPKNEKELDEKDKVIVVQVIVVRNDSFRRYKKYWGGTHLIMALPKELSFENKKISDEQGAVGFSRCCIVEIAKRLRLRHVFMMDDNILCTYKYRRKGDIETSVQKGHNEFSSVQKGDVEEKVLSSGANAALEFVCVPAPLSEIFQHMERQLRDSNMNIEDFKKRYDLKDAEYFPNSKNNMKKIEDYTGNSDMYAIIGTRRALFAPRTKSKFQKTWAYSMVLVNIEAISKKDINYHPGWYMAEDLDFMRRCDEKNLWTVRYNCYLHQKVNRNSESWRHEFVRKIPAFLQHPEEGKKALTGLKKKVYFRKYGRVHELEQMVKGHVFTVGEVNLKGILKYTETNISSIGTRKLCDVLKICKDEKNENPTVWIEAHKAKSICHIELYVVGPSVEKSYNRSDHQFLYEEDINLTDLNKGIFDRIARERVWKQTSVSFRYKKRGSGEWVPFSLPHAFENEVQNFKSSTNEEVDYIFRDDSVFLNRIIFLLRKR